MKKRPTKTTLVLIIILLIIVLPIASYGTYLHVTYVPEAPRCDIDFGNGCYICNNPATCTIAKSMIDDDEYNFNYYKSDDLTVKVSGGVYSFISDNADDNSDNSVVLYNISEGQSLKMTGVKNYGVGINNGYYIAKNDSGLFGIVKVDSIISVGVPYRYTFIGISNNMYKDNVLGDNRFAALKNGSWSIISHNGDDVSTVYDKPIYDYNDSFVALYDEVSHSYSLVDYTGLNIGSGNYKGVLFAGNYMGVLDNQNQFAVFSGNSRSIISQSYNVSDISNVSLDITESGLQIIINGNVMETVS